LKGWEAAREVKCDAGNQKITEKRKMGGKAGGGKKVDPKDKIRDPFMGNKKGEGGNWIETGGLGYSRALRSRPTVTESRS